MAAAVPIGGVDPGVVRAGACAAWPLPPDEGGAGFARAVVKAVCAELRMPATAAYDASVALSELATNVYLHAYGGRGVAAPPSVAGAPGRPRYVVNGGLGGLPELWAYVRWRTRGAPGGCWEPEIVFMVYDAAPWRGPSPAEAAAMPSPVYAEAGRGFQLVGALAAEYGASGACTGPARGWARRRCRARRCTSRCRSRPMRCGPGAAPYRRWPNRSGTC